MQDNFKGITMEPTIQKPKAAKKPTPLALMRSENVRLGTEVEAADIRYLRPSSDLHTNVWGWACGCCGSTSNPPIDTMFRTYSSQCNNCFASNMFDFRKHGA